MAMTCRGWPRFFERAGRTWRQPSFTLICPSYWAAPTVSSVRAGKVTLIANNVGRVSHELIVERMPMKFDSPMHPNEDAAQGMIDDMAPGKSGRMTMRLTPGTYMLFCKAPGHYAAGQHTIFNVTKS